MSKQIVIIPGGFHPYHAGHYALYQSAKEAFPDAEVYVAATNDQSERPFPFAVKEKLAKVAGVEPSHFVQVKSPFQAKEITQHYNPNEDELIFVRSEKDRNESPKPGGMKKDGSPAYFQPYTGKNMQPFGKHAYFAYLPTVKFGPGITSATEIRKAWPTLNDKRKTAMVMSLYPATQKNSKLAANIVGILDQVMGGQEKVTEGVSQPGKAVTDAIQKVLPIAQEIWFHGSRATGKHRRNSDTDILVVVPDELVGDKYLAVVRLLQKLSSHFDNYDIQPTKSGTNIHRIAQEEGQLLWSNKQGVAEDKEVDPVTSAVLSFYKPVVNDIHKEKLPDYVDQARHLLHKTDDPVVRSKLIDIFKTGKENPYIQGGIVTTVGALLAGGVLSTAQSMGLSPAQTNLALQAILNTVIPTVVSRINGKNWSDTIKYTLASAGVGTGIAGAGLIEDDLDENLGLPYPSTYEQEHGPANNNGSQHLVAMTSESSLSKSTDYLEEK